MWVETGFRTLRFPNQRYFRTTPLESAPTHAWMQLWRAGGLLRVCRFLRMISHSLEATGHAYFLPCTPVRDSACSPSHACKQNRWVSHASGWNLSLSEPRHNPKNQGTGNAARYRKEREIARRDRRRHKEKYSRPYVPRCKAALRALLHRPSRVERKILRHSQSNFRRERHFGVPRP